MKPGRTVDLERSMASTPAGGGPPGGTETMLSPSIKTRTLSRTFSDLPSIRWPARVGMRFARGTGFLPEAPGDWAEAGTRAGSTTPANTRAGKNHFVRNIAEPPRALRSLSVQTGRGETLR